MYRKPANDLLVELMMNLSGLYAGLNVCGLAMVVCAILFEFLYELQQWQIILGWQFIGEFYQCLYILFSELNHTS